MNYVVDANIILSGLIDRTVNLEEQRRRVATEQSVKSFA